MITARGLLFRRGGRSAVGDTLVGDDLAQVFDAISGESGFTCGNLRDLRFRASTWENLRDLLWESQGSEVPGFCLSLISRARRCFSVRDGQI